MAYISYENLTIPVTIISLAVICAFSFMCYPVIQNMFRMENKATSQLVINSILREVSLFINDAEDACNMHWEILDESKEKPSE